jgi:hypothetical protein
LTLNLFGLASRLVTRLASDGWIFGSIFKSSCTSCTSTHVDPNGHFYLNAVGMMSDADQLVKALRERKYFLGAAGARTQARRLAQRCAVQGLGLTCRDGTGAAQACAEAVSHGVHSADVILNILARRRDPGPPITILTPAALTLRHEPVADCARYDNLRRTV